MRSSPPCSRSRQIAPELSVLIPSARGGDGLVRLVERLLSDSSSPVEVLVADNGLAPEVRSGLRAAGAEVVEMGHNAGFGQAVNRAAARARAPLLVVANDDVDPQPGFLDALTAPLREGVEMSAGVLVMAERDDVIESAGIVIDRLLGPHDHLHGRSLEALRHHVEPPLGPSGGAAGFAREAFLSVGGYDEGIFAYTEDVDLAIRLRQKGARCEVAAAARAAHLSSTTLGYGSLQKAVVVGRSRGYLMRKYGVLSHPLRGPAALAVEAAACLALALRHRSLAPAAARIRGWRECRVRAEFPARGWSTVGVLAGLRQRLASYRRRPRGG